MINLSTKNLQNLLQIVEEAKIIQITNDFKIIDPKIEDIINYINKENKFFINIIKNYTNPNQYNI